MQVIKYSLDETLNKKLRTLLKDTAILIKANDYDLNYINPYKLDYDPDREHKSDTYIIQLLKTALLKVYLEIQEVFKSYISDDDYMNVDDLYTKILAEIVPEEKLLKTLQINEVGGQKVMDKTITSIPQESLPNSFTYIRLFKRGDNLTKLWNDLKSKQFIDNKTSFGSYKEIFSGQKISNPVVWTGNLSDFHYFIHLICTKHKLVKDLNKNQWRVACQCFVRSDGTPFDKSKVRNLKRPKRTGMLLEKAVELLK